MVSLNEAWLQLCLMLIRLLESIKCEGPCIISANRKMAGCSGKGLRQVPEGLPPPLERLDLSYNRLQQVTGKDFSTLSNLQVLNLGFNNISVIEDNTFIFNVLLEELSIFNNSLSEIPILALRPLRNLKKLDMSNNLYNYSTLDKDFHTFHGLKDLSMGGPMIRVVYQNDFLPLKYIPLQRFALKTTSSLAHYEAGALTVLNTSALWFDIALDTNAKALLEILRDLRNKSLAYLRFRNLFEFTYYTDSLDLFSGLADINVRTLVFFRGKFNENLLRLALSNVQKSPITNLALISIDFARSLNSSISSISINSLTLNNLILMDISNPDVLRFDWTFTWFSQVTNLSITNVNFNFVPCDAWDEMKNVVLLNVSNNRLKENNIFNPACLYQNIVPKMEMFIASNNQLISLKAVALLTTSWPKLTYVNLGYNSLGALNESCVWNPSITTFILHHNFVNTNVFKCLPTSLEYLDMSNSQLDRLDMEYFSQTQNLRELWLSSNKIKFIPSNWKSLNLQVLAVDGNSFGVISTNSFDNMPELTMLQAGNNPYHCTCDLNSFIKKTLQNGQPRLLDWPEDYTCYHPQALLDTRVELFSPGQLECDISLVVAISVSVTAALVILCMLLCWKFDIPWYLKATCQIVQAKYRSRQDTSTRTYTYHAFVSYSHSDADWVRGELLYRLENSSPPYSICIHERDFLPGKWIIDNIIENIEMSQKVILVLSRNFVNSEWCNYELYFAHQRAIGHAFEDVILVVKETISLDSLPSKFCRLRKMLSNKTYLEWPAEPNRQPFFWMQLKNVLGKASVGVSPQGGFSLVNKSVVVDLPTISGNMDSSVDCLPSGFSPNLP
uniref:Toll-like receptor 2 n=1 Tax=Geotrypetes seraphini TaxID=260995 RepID=A0A6P8PA47_GEOSA|nr:toll-like receptor 2 [Geotrypetes seraphini]XP_033780656.1 toll-like receptor 2 [Geotrypetes seraphini]